jgi:hypothetical protein
MFMFVDYNEALPNPLVSLTGCNDRLQEAVNYFQFC